MPLAEVVEIVGRTGIYGEVIQVMCKMLEGKESENILRRNVRTPVRVGDIISLKEIERESRPIETAQRKLMKLKNKNKRKAR
ncbi:MAG: 30S ribosomal protein S28e [Candidatus Altiarchaeum hamiconexum]|uniref:30S ribosomal protein S28e n=1 Tax=Candidatus Altarchaeum hamiconexum TaxID=1803513 RepID=A0A8J8CHF0_9ARCH|nr:30S ribosomal protein S28e [Candidatus Altarchaeum hamiconexum]OIQ05885.1 MAG: 30S ribosomal protein S28e [Candidatus Altarchaeum sp. CG2_30_32_3053]PIN66953.1 MAG: 30S ribosomal protein S28e [Candidatus Altarchaeum sp. CG12_big_fil_rev_8_21_14_0_65_33_22]PIV27889.1 MAG: 30S ribosomal protein S28e [Candidatus Altarchaeum sp. CG03_land_8_20_14_0_80_32_618]PIX48355.1 MAG: 30S ribosomal protein S28e [Candidatus Altarchaeum sp. CG_4_8_14_3_um_filter_33_2054]PIZ29231.1 MAG: 30S ribosomal protein